MFGCTHQTYYHYRQPVIVWGIFPYYLLARSCHTFAQKTQLSSRWTLQLSSNLKSEFCFKGPWTYHSRSYIITFNNSDNLNTPESRTACSDQQYSTNLRRGLARDLGKWFAEIVGFKPALKSGVSVQTWLQGVVCSKSWVQMIEKQRSQNYYLSMVVQGDWNWLNDTHGQDSSGSVNLLTFWHSPLLKLDETWACIYSLKKFGTEPLVNYLIALPTLTSLEIWMQNWNGDLFIESRYNPHLTALV